MADLGGNLDIFASLHSSLQLLHDLDDAPGQVERVVGEITHQWLAYYEKLDGIIASAGAGELLHGTKRFVPHDLAGDVRTLCDARLGSMLRCHRISLLSFGR